MDVANPGHAAALWVGLHILLMLVLSLLVVRLRNKHKVFLGDEGIPELAQAIRAFGNASEYVPPGLAGLIVLDLSGATPLLIHIAGFVLLVSRIVHAAGLYNSVGTSIPRALGMTMTWGVYVFLVAALLISAVV